MQSALARSLEARAEAKILSFFFDATGAALENSIEGMYRTLLYHFADDVPQVLKMVRRKALRKPSE